MRERASRPRKGSLVSDRRPLATSRDTRLEALAADVLDVGRAARTEEDIRIGFERALMDAAKDLGIEMSQPRYERSYHRSELRGRSDAVHGRLVIEYEPPKALK